MASGPIEALLQVLCNQTLCKRLKIPAARAVSYYSWGYPIFPIAMHQACYMGTIFLWSTRVVHACGIETTLCEYILTTETPSRFLEAIRCSVCINSKFCVFLHGARKKISARTTVDWNGLISLYQSNHFVFLSLSRSPRTTCCVWCLHCCCCTVGILSLNIEVSSRDRKHTRHPHGICGRHSPPLTQIKYCSNHPKNCPGCTIKNMAVIFRFRLKIQRSMGNRRRFFKTSIINGSVWCIGRWA